MGISLLVCCHSFPPAYADGGPVQSVGNLVRTLVREGTAVTVFTTNRNGNSRLCVPLGTPTDWNGAKVYYFKVYKPWWYGFTPDCILALRNEVKKADVIHSTAIFSFLPDLGAWLAKVYNKPYVISPRGNLSPIALKKGWLKKHFYYNVLVRSILNSANVVHCMTPMDADWVIRLGIRTPVICVPNGVDLSEINRVRSFNSIIERIPRLRDKQIVMFLGRIDKIKGLDLLLKSWSFITTTFPNTALVIVGPDPKGYRSFLESLSIQLKINNSVHFVGEWTGIEKNTLLSSADLFVMPSYTENFGMSIAEALALGVPVLASDRCGIVSYLHPGEDVFVVPCEVEALSIAIRKLLLDKELRMRIGESGQHRAKELFDIKNIARSMLTIYGDTIKHAKA
jgi:glycosyltransferase involved in cell wall biosynthesis